MTVIREETKHTIVESDSDTTTIVDKEVVEVLISTLVGPAGEDASAEEHVHNQAIPSDTWTINHPLTTDTPSVIVIDSAEDLVYGGVNYTTTSQVVVTFSAGFAGKARLL